MPVIKSAQKKLRQDKKRKAQNDAVRDVIQKVVKLARKSPSDKTIREAVRAIDKAVKKHILHKNKAARVKSSLSKLLAAKSPVKAAAKTTEKAKKITPKKPAKK